MRKRKSKELTPCEKAVKQVYASMGSLNALVATYGTAAVNAACDRAETEGWPGTSKCPPPL